MQIRNARIDERDAICRIHASAFAADYGRFGFSAEAAARYRPPCPLQHHFGWQAIELSGAAPDAASMHIACVAALDKPELW